MRYRLLAPLVAAACLMSLPVAGQVQVDETVSRYEALYGTPVEVSIEDLVMQSSSYERRAVRTKGRLDVLPGTFRAFMLKSPFNQSVNIVPVEELAGELERQGLQDIGREVEVAGVFLSDQGAPTIRYWEYLGPPDEKAQGPIASTASTLEALVTQPGKRDGQVVRVIGKFRGRNLYGDLPTASQRASADWVIKDDAFAIWVSGRKPKGSGWQLDPSLKRDTGKWIEVVGKPETRGGVTYIRAMKVSLSAPPSANATVAPPPPPPERPKVPPVVVFAMPLDGESEVPSDSRFIVQFSKDMDESSFEGRIRLRYAGPRLAGDREFDGLKLSYDRGRRALTVDPGDVLRPNRRIELLLLPGIVDVDGMALVPRMGKELVEGAEVLRFQVGSGAS